MLDPFSRGAIVAMSALCIAGAVALAPIRARSSIQDARLQPLPVTAMTSDTMAIVPIRRDPFAIPVPRVTDVARAPMLAGRSATLEALPSNLTSDTIPAIPGVASGTATGTPRITAVVTGAGAHPYAMIETGDRHEIKGIGDSIAGVAIVSIDLGGIRLQNGGRLTFNPAEGQR